MQKNHNMPWKRNKYRAKRTERKDRSFDSKLEAKYYDKLLLLQKAGEVDFFLQQVPFHLPGKTKYVCDFMVFYADGTVKIIDCKGVETSTFKLKKRQVEELYPVEIEIVKKV